MSPQSFFQPAVRSEYFKHLKDEGRYSVTTLTIISGWLEKLERFAGNRKLAELKAKDLERWRKELAWKAGPSGRMLSENTQNQAVLAVRGFYRWLVANGFVPTDPAEGLKVRRLPKKAKTSFTVAERRAILGFSDRETAVGIRDRAVLGLLLETGISKPACSSLDLSDLALDIGALMAKGRSGGLRTISDGLSADLERYLRESRPVLVGPGETALFVNAKGQRLSQASVQGLWRRALQSLTPSSP